MTVEGAAVLEEVLIEYLSELRTKIAHTDAPEFRERLKRKETFLRKILQQIATQGLSHTV
ncbi:MAG TPA: hypothetical protein VM716_03375 [Gemmatimonadales bacterium]|nr:hypothetical protein [Gemmatimonadales bacterium]